MLSFWLSSTHIHRNNTTQSNKYLMCPAGWLKEPFQNHLWCQANYQIYQEEKHAKNWHAKSQFFHKIHKLNLKKPNLTWQNTSSSKSWMKWMQNKKLEQDHSKLKQEREQDLVVINEMNECISAEMLRILFWHATIMSSMNLSAICWKLKAKWKSEYNGLHNKLLIDLKWKTKAIFLFRFVVWAKIAQGDNWWFL